MALASSDLRVFRAATNDDTAGNGGRMGTSESVSGVSGNLFPRVSLAERTSGLTRLRKAFHRVFSSGQNPLYDAHLFMFKHTPAADAVTYFATDFTSLQSDVSGVLASQDHYGGGELANSVVAGATEVQVTPEQDAYTVFRTGDRIYITDKSQYSGTGNEEYCTITNVTGTTTLTLTVSTPLLYDYNAAGTRVVSVMDTGTVAVAKEIVSQTVADTGIFSDTNMTVSQRGGIYHDITLTFTSATGYTATSDQVGALGSGSTGSTFAPVNPNTSATYFSIPSTCWSGVFTSGDVVILRTTPAAVPVWYVQTVPELSPEFSGNSFSMVFAGETD